MNKVKFKFVSLFAFVGFAAALLYGPSLALAATSPTLGAAGSYSVLAGSTVTNTGPTTVPGDLGVSPGSAVTGFPPGIVGPPGTIHTADASAAAAQLANGAAFLALSAPPNVACDHDFGAVVQDLVGLTLVPGVYCANAFTLSGTLTLNDTGAPNGVWIFRSASTLITSSGIGAKVQFLNGIGSPCNVWWKVGSSATIGVGTTFIGNILALTSIALQTNASLNGRALAQNGAVTMDGNHVTACGSGGTLCGNGVIDGSETCDLGASNGVPGSGCSSSCAVEAGFQCTGSPLVCAPIGPIPAVCGDGIISGSETCDAGKLNGVPGSGCSATCTVEAGFQCSGQPSVCLLPCPDKFVGLGASGSCSVLETDGGKVSLSFGGPTGVGGDVCIPGDGSLSISGGQVVTGKVRLETGAHFQESSSASFDVVNEGTNGLDAEIADCQGTSAVFAAKTCPPGTTITTLKNQTITGICGENVYCVKDVNVGNKDTVTITAPNGCTTATFIFNVTGKFAIHGSDKGGKIVAGANVTPSQIFYNVIGPGQAVAFSGGGGGTGCCNASVDGSLFAEDRTVNLAPGKVNGVICSEKDISIVSGSLVCPAGF